MHNKWERSLHNDAVLEPVCNEAQLRAITHESGPALCLAGPGSGKTYTLTHHIRYLILEKHIDPSQILVITFSKAAAIEMQQRFTRLMEDTYYPVRFGTFHAIFFQILSRYEGYSTKDILTITRKKQYLKTALAQMDYQGKEDVDTLMNILQQISYVKNCGSTSALEKSEQDSPQFKEIYRNYEAVVRQEHALDYDDMLLLCYRLFRNRPDILEEYRKDINHVLVDEYQDINPVQYEIVKMLVGSGQNLFAVGDDDQSIYGFRGSKPEIMLRFQEDFPSGVIIPFQTNYRSASGIVKCASQLINRNNKRYQKELSAAKEGDGVHFYPYKSKEEEYEDLLKRLKQAQKEGTLERCACLYRTNMDASYLAERLLKEKIPYTMKEKAYNPYDHFICRDFLHYLHLKEGDLNIQEFVPVMNRPLRYLSREALFGECVDFEQMFAFYREKPYMKKHIQKLQYDLNWMKRMDPFATVNYIRKGIGYDDYLRKLALEQNQSVDVYLKTADELQKRFALFDSVDALEEHIINYRESEKEFLGNSVSKQKDEKGVKIMTYHTSKGLEFDTVYLPDCNEGTIPHKKSASPEQIEEERRLFYVAMTRAKENLHIMYVEGNREEKHLVSRFVKDIAYISSKSALSSHSS